MTTSSDNLLGAIAVILTLAALVGGLIALLERTHRRTERLSRAPFGADLEGDRDILRTLAELDAARAHGTPEPHAARDARAAIAAHRRRQLQGPRQARPA